MTTEPLCCLTHREAEFGIFSSSSSLPHINKNEQRERVRGAARNLVSQGYLAGMELDEIVEELRSASREMKEKV